MTYSPIDPQLQGLVIDPGSYMWKCGFCGDDAPRAAFPSIVGRPCRPAIMVGMDAKDCFVGDECMAKRAILDVKYPVHHGVPVNWNDYEKILHHSFYNELCVTPEEHPVFVADAPLNPAWVRPTLAAILFETFNVPGLYFANSGLLSLYAAGESTGLIVGVGEGLSQVTPANQGYADPAGIVRSNIGGADVTDFLLTLLPTEPYDHSEASHDREIVRDLKEKLCFVREETHQQQRASSSLAEEEETLVKYRLPDYDVLTVPRTSVLGHAPEVLFQPSLIKSKAPGIQDLVKQSIRNCEPDFREHLLQNVVLDGGSTFFEGFPARLKSELVGVFSASEEEAIEGLGAHPEIQVKALPERKFLSWIGGSMMASLQSFASLWITKDEYDECGGSVVFDRLL